MSKMQKNQSLQKKNVVGLGLKFSAGLGKALDMWKKFARQRCKQNKRHK